MRVYYTYTGTGTGTGTVILPAFWNRLCLKHDTFLIVLRPYAYLLPRARSGNCLSPNHRTISTCSIRLVYMRQLELAGTQLRCLILVHFMDYFSLHMPSTFFALRCRAPVSATAHFYLLNT